MDDKLILCVRAHTDLRKQFLEVARKNSPEPRRVYTFLTTATVRIIYFFFGSRTSSSSLQDTRAMGAILATIRSSIVSNNLQAAVLLQ